MTNTNTGQHSASPHYRGPPTHHFTIGQRVHLKLRFGQPLRFADIYRVTARLPPQDESPQYRVRSDNEPHERMVPQSGLLAAGGTAPPGDGAGSSEGLALSKEKRRGNREIRKPKQRETPLSAPERAAGKPNGGARTTDAPSHKGTRRPA